MAYKKYMVGKEYHKLFDLGVKKWLYFWCLVFGNVDYMIIYITTSNKHERGGIWKIKHFYEEFLYNAF